VASGVSDAFGQGHPGGFDKWRVQSQEICPSNAAKDRNQKVKGVQALTLPPMGGEKKPKREKGSATGPPGKKKKKKKRG